MSITYDSKYTGEQIDNFDNRITALESAVTLFTNNLSNYLTNSIFNEAIDDLDSAISDLNSEMASTATKTEVNNLSMVPSNSYVEIPRLITSKPTDWANFMSAYTAPTNGYLSIYFTGCSNKPAFQVNVTGSMQYRGNGNGSRDVGLLMPVRKG